MGKSNGYDEEHISFVPHETEPNRFVPQIKTARGKVREFTGEDMARVLDYEGIKEHTGDGSLMFCEYDDTTGLLQFPVYHFCLRGGFLFYFDPADVDEKSGPYTTYEGPPVGCVSLDNVVVNFPPGGRRVFREHAHTEAQSGYELIILHQPPRLEPGTENGENGGHTPMRPPAFLVVDSLSQRKDWAAAIKVRSEKNQRTLLRAGYQSTKSPSAEEKDRGGAAEVERAPESNKAARKKDSRNGDGGGGARNEMLQMTTQEETKPKKSFTAAAKAAAASSASSSARARNRETKSIEKQIMEVSDDAELAAAVVEFGAADFQEKEWMNKFFETHNDYDAPSMCRQMEGWQLDMKKSLKGAVLEQYEYFVQASGEMTTMGEEVSSLKNEIETQLETFTEMKEIDFLGPLQEEEDEEEDDEVSEKDEIMGQDDDNSELGDLDKRLREAKGSSILSEVSSVDVSGGIASIINKHRGVQESQDDEESEESAPPIEVPDWVEDVDEEIAAIVRECRYNSAIELYQKAKAEIADLMEKHESPSPYRLTKKQLSMLRTLRKSLKLLGDRISARLEESLRRKNEALRQAYRRERSDQSNVALSLVSPSALNDDSVQLQLLVKLGRTQEAAEAYSARRSMLLLETLQERPISGSGAVDLVVYAAQLSQSFFSCLASSVEGFLDLFHSAPDSVSGTLDRSEDSEVSSIQSSVLGTTTKNLPAGAVASLVLWCDSELGKFAVAFGGTRVLANLALSAPTRDAPKGPRVVGNGPVDGLDTSKDRKNAIEVAAQCIDQAFMYATQNLDSVGLPLTPRLAEMLRARLKGCEKEVAELLDERWQHLTQDWRAGGDLDRLLGSGSRLLG